MDLEKPLAHPIFGELIKLQWFNKGSSDHMAFSIMMKEHKIYDPTYLLAITSVWAISTMCFIQRTNITTIGRAGVAGMV